MGGKPHGALSQNDYLLQFIRSGYRYAVAPIHLLGNLFYVLIGSFSLLGKYYMDIIVLNDCARVVFHFIAVKYYDYMTFFLALVIAQGILEGSSGGV